MVQQVIDFLIFQCVRFLVLFRHPRLTRRYLVGKSRSWLPNPALPDSTFEKWVWRKVFDHNPDFTQVSDKLAVKDWIKSRQIAVETPEVLWVGTDAGEIPDEALEGGVVLKANHGCDMNIFLREPPNDRTAINLQANEFLDVEHGAKDMQWGYLGIRRKLFVEKLLDTATDEIKLYTFGRHIARAVLIYERFSDMSADVWIMDENNQLQRGKTRTLITDKMANRPLPDLIEEALPIASDIGEHFDHMRVDFMTDGKSLWLGELTVYNMTGHFAGMHPDEEELLNKAWDIRRSWFLSTPQSGWRGVYARALRRRLDAAANPST